MGDDDGDDDIRGLDAGAARVSMAYPLKAYLTGTTTLSMPKLVQKVVRVKNEVQEWDLIQLTLAKPLLAGHLRILDPRSPDYVLGEGPMESTKR